VYAGHRVGLAYPLLKNHSASVFGVVPGLAAPLPTEAVAR
jgi:hypothetical protein